MHEFSTLQIILISLVFVWGGAVRTALGFGGAVLALPLLLVIHDEPLFFLPIIAAHVLFFSVITIAQNNYSHKKQTSESTVDWQFLAKALAIMVIPKIAGVLGLINLPSHILNTIILSIITVYSLTYIFNKPFKSQYKWADIVFLVLGGYVSGTSLIGAPLVVAVFAKYLKRYQLRDTLLALWFILVSIKMASFIYFEVDLHLKEHLWLLPCAMVGHLIGLRLHNYFLKADTVKFYRFLGLLLLATSIIGLYRVW